MIHNETVEIIFNVTRALKEIILAGAGGVVAYLYDYSRISKVNAEHKWSNKALAINTVLGVFVGYVIGSLIPLDVSFRDAVIAFSGVSAVTILGIVESRFATLIIEKLTGKKLDEK